MTRRYIDELRFSAGAAEELAAHGLSEDDVLEVSWDKPAFFKDKVARRDLMIGRTVDGRLLTIVIQQTATAGIWHVVTGWKADKGQRTAWENVQPWRTRK